MADPSPPDGGLRDAGADANASFPANAVDDPTGICGTPKDATDWSGGVPPLPIVSPLIWIQTPIVLVKKPYMGKPTRQPVLLSTDQAFDGKGTFTVTSGAGNIRFFSLAVGGFEISSGHVFSGAVLSLGTIVYAQGEKASTSEKDVTLQLELTPGCKPVNPPVTSQMTSVEVTLDICKGRSKAGDSPSPLSDDDKIKIGRFIHSQDAAMHRHRALLIVRQAKPKSFTGTLVLTPKDGKVKLYNFADDPPAAGQASFGQTKKPNPAIPADGLKFWVEGDATPSGALRDTGFTLGVDGVDPDGDRVALTVFKVNKISAKLRATPCKRDGSRADVMLDKSTTADSKIFDAWAITIVRECGDLKVTATVTPPAVQLTWLPERAADDHNSLKGLPTHSVDGDNKKHILKADATGSFHLHVFVDADGNGKRDLDDDGLILNMIMVEVSIPGGAANNKIVTNPNFSNARSSASSLVVDSATSLGNFNVAPAINGVYNDAQFTQHLIGIRVTVNLVGGGPDKFRGLNKVLLGFIQQTTGDSVKGTYADGKTEKEVIFASPIPAGPVVPPPPPPPPPPAPPSTLAMPVRDTRGPANNGTGTFIISSSDNNPPPAKRNKRIVRFIDSPAIVIDMTHPVSASPLASIAGTNDFADFLVAFSLDFDENFTVLATATWKVSYGTFAAPPGWTNATAAVVPSGAIMTVLSPPKKGESLNMERCPPNFVDNLVMDAR